jgi:hypothetical protein
VVSTEKLIGTLAFMKFPTGGIPKPVRISV